MVKAKAISRVIRREVLASLEGLDNVAIALSGGVDSCSLLGALLTVDVKPVVISYTPETHDSTDFLMAWETAKRLGLCWEPCLVDMSAEALERSARTVIALGYKEKVEVECLSPVVSIMERARDIGVKYVVTGDQADGYFALSKWASHNADRAAGIPRGERTNVQRDTTPDRIDFLRDRYWELDRSCSAGVKKLAASHQDMRALVPYRNERIRAAFRHSLWSEVNRPRFKEPIRLAFDKELADIPTRKLPVNLHKGDSYFAERMGQTLLNKFPGPWLTARGLYHAMARGDV